MVDATNTRDAATARERALRELRAAERAVNAWVDLIREGAAQRVGSVASDAVVRDPAYSEALRLWASVHEGLYVFGERAAVIDAGEDR